MKRRSISMILTLGTLTAAITFPGCTLVGFLAGTGIDDSIADRDTLSPPEFSTVKQGEDVIVKLRRGNVISGTCVSLDTLSPAEYAKNYNACRRANTRGEDLPLLGDSVTLYPPEEQSRVLPTVGGDLIGFDNSVIVLRTRGRSVALRIKVIQTIADCHGHVIEKAALCRLMDDGNIALMTELVLETGNGHVHLPMERIEQMERPKSKNIKYILGGLGLAVDAIIVVLAASSSFLSF